MELTHIINGVPKEVKKKRMLSPNTKVKGTRVIIQSILFFSLFSIFGFIKRFPFKIKSYSRSESTQPLFKEPLRGVFRLVAEKGLSLADVGSI